MVPTRPYSKSTGKSRAGSIGIRIIRMYKAIIKPVLIRYHRPLVIGLHLMLILVSNYLAFWLRFDGEIPQKFLDVMWMMLPALLAIRGVLFGFHRLYQGLWRYTSIVDLWNIISSTLISSLLFYVLVHIALDVQVYPRSVFIMDSLLLIFFLGGIRLPWRVHREFRRSTNKGSRVLIYGAGDAGEMLVRDMRMHPNYNYNPIGFIDDDPTKKGERIHRVQVFGGRNHLSDIIRRHKVDVVMVAIPSATPETLREIVKILEPFHIPIKTLPNLEQILEGKVSVQQVRDLSVEDLLTRMPVSLDLTPVQRLLERKRVLVTGAGGSIGSELCRQIVKMNPSRLILFERYENSLHTIVNELTYSSGKDRIIPLVGDVQDRFRVEQILGEYKPDLIFHAAAHKHVPLMERNPCEAVKNNITGTRILARAAARNKVAKFVFVSTDKAVNPTSVMGASKRVAEMIVRIIGSESDTEFVTVRFGNVLGSNGSVVPLFLQQIHRHGPVTVTHPDMKRFFMLIPEAVQLMLLAAAMGQGADTYVLEMGEQINVTEMARNLIRLSGFIPEKDIPIIFTGIRPGEKLYEELVGADETAEQSYLQEILKIRPKLPVDPVLFKKKIRQLEKSAAKADHNSVFQCFLDLVPTFTPTYPPVS